MKETEVAGLRGVDAVPYPVGLYEDHHGDDDEADGEHGPHDADGAGVSHIVGVIDFSGLLGWKQVHVSEQKGKKISFCRTFKSSTKQFELFLKTPCLRLLSSKFYCRSLSIFTPASAPTPFRL